jgi:hypothetical protein
MDEKFIPNYYDQCGREISLAMDTINSNQNWTITLITAIIAGLILLGFQPSIWTWSLLVIGLALTIRYFVRTCVAYSHLIRWNIMRNKINDVYLFAENKDEEKNRALKELSNAIENYDKKWLLPMRRRDLILSNLKYGYYYAFFSIILLMAYSLYSVYVNTGFSGPISMQILAVGILGVLVVLWEIRGFFDFPYFKVKLPGQTQAQTPVEQTKKSRPRLNKRFAAGTILLIVVLIGAGLCGISESNNTLLQVSALNVLVRDYNFSNPMYIKAGTLVEISWNSSSFVGVGFTQDSSIGTYNETGILKITRFVEQQQGKLEITVASAGDYTLFVAKYSPVRNLTIVINESTSPFATYGIAVSATGLGILVLMVIDYAKKQMSAERLPSAKTKQGHP